MNRRFMAMHAVILQDFAAARVHLNWFVKVLERKGPRVAPPVIGFGKVLGNELVRQVAIDTRGHRMMAGVLPGVVLRLHDMAVRASSWIRAEVRPPLAIAERKETQAGQHTHTEGEKDPQC
jgi:hypothetical protein